MQQRLSRGPPGPHRRGAGWTRPDGPEDSAERHAKDVRARVQREAKRVADLAAAAMTAAAAGGTETAEYPMVGSHSSFVDPAPTSPPTTGPRVARRERPAW